MKTPGFTLVELLVVMAVLATLLTLVIPRYHGSVQRAKEAALRENLYQLRDAIGKYYADRGKYPDSLQALASDRYLHRLPADPITGSAVTWVAVPPVDPELIGVWDVRSGAPGRASDGTEFSTW